MKKVRSFCAYDYDSRKQIFDLYRVSAEFGHFNHKMEIALSVKSFAFYHSSQSIFIQGKVLEINHYPDSEPIFQLVQKGTQQNFKFAGDCEKYFHLLSKETIAIESTKIEEGKLKQGHTKQHLLPTK